jgi:hypothetical protein
MHADRAFRPPRRLRRHYFKKDDVLPQATSRLAEKTPPTAGSEPNQCRHSGCPRGLLGLHDTRGAVARQHAHRDVFAIATQADVGTRLSKLQTSDRQVSQEIGQLRILKADLVLVAREAQSDAGGQEGEGGGRGPGLGNTGDRIGGRSTAVPTPETAEKLG